MGLVPGPLLACLTIPTIVSPPSAPKHPEHQQVIVALTDELLGMATAQLLRRPQVRALAGPPPAIFPHDLRLRPRHDNGLSPAPVVLQNNSMFHRGHIIPIVIKVRSFPIPASFP